MKTRIAWLVLVLVFVGNAFAQSPFVRNSFSTNTPGEWPLTNPPAPTTILYPPLQKLGVGTIYNPHVFGLTRTNASLEGDFSANGGLFTNSLTSVGPLTASSAHITNGFQVDGVSQFNADVGVLNLTANTFVQTPILSAPVIHGNQGDFTNTLTLNGSPVLTNAAGDVTNTYNTIIATNVNFINGNGNKITISNSLTINTNGALRLDNLARPAVLVLGTNGNATNATLSGLTLDNNNNLTASGGDTTGTNIVTLTMTGTNVSTMDFSLIQSGGVFKLVLTGNAFVGTPSNVGNTVFRKAWLMVQQPSTGTCYVNFTNGTFCYSEGAAPVNDTNNGSVSVYEMVSDVFTNGLVHLSMVAKSKLLTNSVP